PIAVHGSRRARSTAYDATGADARAPAGVARGSPTAETVRSETADHRYPWQTSGSLERIAVHGGDETGCAASREVKLAQRHHDAAVAERSHEGFDLGIVGAE